MVKDFAVVLPVRDGGFGRAERLKECIASWEQYTEGMSKIYVIIDEDDTHNFTYLLSMNSDVLEILIQSPKNTLMQKINTFSHYIADNHKYMIFIGDDIVFTCKWESQFAEYLSSVPYGIAYANDGFQGDKLATHPCVTSNLVKSLGFFGCPGVVHYFFDNYWMAVGHETGYIKYFPDILMNHRHFLNGKSIIDGIYVRAMSMATGDEKRFVEYMEKFFESDLEKIRRISD